MCGLNGAFAFHGAAPALDEDEIIRIRENMMSRGPDSAGYWTSVDRRAAFGHRRLAIQDLSASGHQPMVSACGRYCVVFNGEIYNYPDLRKSLEAQGRVFSSRSDTEVLLHLFDLYGLAMLSKLRGMFAFAIWSQESRSLFLARDPYGIKPLYTSCDGQTFRFASQVKALLAGGAIPANPDPAGAVGFFLWGSVPEPFTLFNQIVALPAGHFQIIDASGPKLPQSYLDISALFANGALHRLPAEETAGCVRSALFESVKAHLIADVEVGVFLSAGVDSGALLGLMQNAGQRKVKAITLAFEEFRGTLEDEAPLASTIANQYGAEHIVRFVDRKEFNDDLPRILSAMDQPSIDGLNTWFVSKACHEAGIKVALSGLGGDEIFAGYPSFKDIPRWTRQLSILRVAPNLGKLARVIAKLVGLGKTNPKAISLLEHGGTYAGAYLLRRGLFMPYELDRVLSDPKFVEEGLRRLDPISRVEEVISIRPTSPVSIVAALESKLYLRNQLLRDADWAGMAHSLEIRTPLVDVPLAQTLSGVTATLKSGDGKRLVAAAPTPPLKDETLSRPKTGFVVPTHSWMKDQMVISGEHPSHKGLVSRSWAQFVFERQNQTLR